MGWTDRIRQALGAGSSPVPWDALATDMHAHWLPGLDDGVASIDEAIDLLGGLEALGYRAAIATPHIMADHYRNDAASIKAALADVRQAAAQAGLKIRLDAAAEYYLDDSLFSALEHSEVLSLAGRFLLFELSYLNRPSGLQQAIFAIQTSGLQPILAHPERYPYLVAEPNLSPFRELCEQGVLLQINLGSLLGHYGPESRRCARQLIDAGLVHFAGTDAHRPGQVSDLNGLTRDAWLGKLLSSGKLLHSQLHITSTES
jgi:protein-tyrosine phosphatase